MRLKRNYKIYDVPDKVLEKYLYVGATDLDELLFKLGQKTKNKRLKKRMTLKDLANDVGVSISLISQFENGKSALSIASLLRISRALKMPFEIK